MNRNERQQLAGLYDEVVLRRARTSLRFFAEWTWPILEPGTVFQPNWHLDLVCEYLEAVSAGEIHRLVINLPPRYMKSLLVSVFWPAWEWVRRPSGRWLFSSYAETLASRHSLDRRRVIRSAPYQRLAPLVRLAKDQQEKLEFHNTKGGIMVATSTGGSVTGKGGNRLILDDPHNPMQVESDTQRTHALDFFNYTLSTRLDNPSRDAVVLVMQRLHLADLTARCLELGYEHLCLPATAPSRTAIVFPRSGRSMVREEDSVLWPERESREQLDERRSVLGSFGFSAQYQQQPVPRTGGYFPPEWWQWFEIVPTRIEVIQSWDLSFKDGAHNDYVVGLVAGRIGANVYLLDRYKAKASFVQTCEAIRRMATHWPQTRIVLVEDAANGPAVINMLRTVVPGLVAVTPQGGKIARAEAVQPLIEAKQVFLPRYRLTDGAFRHEYAWVDDFVQTCAAFPKGEHDDDVDALTQLLVRCQQRPCTQDMTRAILRMMTRDDDRDDPESDRDFHGYRPDSWGMRKP